MAFERNFNHVFPKILFSCFIQCFLVTKLNYFALAREHDPFKEFMLHL